MMQASQNRGILNEKTILGLGIAMILGPAVIFGLNVQITEMFFGAKDVLSQSPVGEVIRLKKVVKKRGEVDPAFDVARAGDPVFDGDTILTGKDSMTRLTLSDGNVLELGPESLIKIEPVRSFGFGGIKRKIKITVQAGTVRAKARPNTAPMVVESPTGQVLMEIAPPAATPAPAPAPPIAATSPGEIPAATPVETPEVDDFVSVAAAPTPTPTPVPVSTPVTTAASAPQSAPSSAPPNLPEAKTESLSPAELIAAEEKKSIERKEVQEVVAEKPLMSRVTLMANKKVETIAVITPAPQGLISDETELKAQSFRLKWRGGGISVVPPYQVTLETNGNTSVISTDKTEIVWPIPHQAEGKLEWTVEVPLKDGGSIRSPKQTATWKLPIPALGSPASDFDVPVSYLKGKNRTLLLTWKEMPICKGYEVAVSPRPDFSKVLFKKVTETHFQNFPVPATGSYYWRVYCQYSEDFSLPGETRKFNVKDLGTFEEQGP